MRRCALCCTVLVLSLVCAARAQKPLRSDSSSASALKKFSLSQFPFSFSARHLRIPLPAAQNYVSLPDSFIIANSDSLVWQQRPLQRGNDYAMELAQRRLRLLTPLIGDTLEVYYHILPVRFAARQFLFSLGLPAAADTFLPVSGIVRPARRSEFTNELAGANLTKRGSLVRGISIGTNQALKVDSGLRLEISGRVANKVDVVASLTDQNTPIQPEGNTQTLQEIDKVFVQLKGENVRATLGDYEFSLTNTQGPFAAGEFARYARKLQGAMVTGEFGNAAATLSAAVSRGRFATNEFRGIEGNQGPYQLTGDRGQIDLIVLAGTERVWLDGQLMTRGESNDYVIEYGNGQITFTRNRLITQDSRLTVDFQFSDERFRRSLYAAAGGYRAANDRLRVQGAFIRETDDQDNPLAFTLSDSDRMRLDAAGDGLAFKKGEREVAPGTGAYVFKDSFFVYVGVESKLGNYNVSFSDVGQGRGDYSYQGFGNYKYEGKNKGRYAPVILLTPAQRRDLIDGRIELQPWKSLSFVNELALSNNDLNLYSSLDDGDNLGRALLSQMSWHPNALRLGGRNFGKASLQLRYRSRGERYRDIDRSDVVEFNRRWDLAPQQSIFGENTFETAARYEPLDGLLVHGGLGRLRRGDDLESDRWEAGTEWTRPRWPSLSYQIEQIERTASRSIGTSFAKNDWLRQRGQASYVFGLFNPSIGYEGERKTDADTTSGGFQFNSYSAGLNLLPWRRMTAAANVNYRRDELGVGENLSPYSTAVTQNYEWNLESWRALSASLSFTHRERRFDDRKTSDTRTDLADARLRFAPWQRALITDWHYQITNTQVATQEEVYLSVPVGQGNYSFRDSLNRYVPDPFGNFVRRVIPTETFVPVVEVRASTTWRFSVAALQRGRKPPSPGGAPSSRFWRWLSPLSTETQIRIEEKTTEPDVWGIYRLNLRRFLSDSTIFGSQNFRQDVHLWENNREKSFRYRLILRKERSRQFLESASNIKQIRHEFRLTAVLSPQTSGRFEYVRNHEDRTFDIPGRNRFLRGNTFFADVSYRPQQDLEVATVFGLNLDKDEFPKPATSVRALLARPRVVYSFRRRGRLRGEIEWVDVEATPSKRVLPFELAGGNRLGRTVRWNFSFEYRLSSNFQATASYDGRREPDRPQTLHLGKVEMRAFF